MQERTKEEVCGTLLRTFYATDDGYVDVNWADYTPWAHSYPRLFWVWDGIQDEPEPQIVAALRPDQGRLLLIHTALCMLMEDRLATWIVDDDGKMVISDLSIPDKCTLPDWKGNPQSFLVRANAFHPDRNYHEYFPTVAHELTNIYITLEKFLWHLTQ